VKGVGWHLPRLYSLTFPRKIFSTLFSTPRQLLYSISFASPPLQPSNVAVSMLHLMLSEESLIERCMIADAESPAYFSHSPSLAHEQSMRVSGSHRSHKPSRNRCPTSLPPHHPLLQAFYTTIRPSVPSSPTQHHTEMQATTGLICCPTPLHRSHS
jgi:hypothetical protein